MPGLELSETHQRCADVFTAHLSDIKAAVAYVARKHRLSADDQEEFTGLVYLKLMSGDFAVFRKFREQSSLQTYLTVVIQRVFLDDRISRWGKWRPSTRVRREGRAAVLFERLTVRDGWPPDQACAAIRQIHGPEACHNLEQLSGTLRRRSRRLAVSDRVLDNVPCPAAGADSLIAAAERRRTVRRTAAALAKAFAELPPADRLILRLRFVENLRISAIAQRIGMPSADNSKVLYTRIERQLMSLGRALERSGLSRADILEAIGTPDAPMIRLFARDRQASRRATFTATERPRAGSRSRRSSGVTAGWPAHS